MRTPVEFRVKQQIPDILLTFSWRWKMSDIYQIHTREHKLLQEARTLLIGSQDLFTANIEKNTHQPYSKSEVLGDLCCP